MRWLRRIILAVSEIVGLLFLIGATVLGAQSGAFLQAYNPFVYDDPMIYYAAGAAIGFLSATLALAVLFALLEIAANTRELVRQRDTGQGGQRWN